jgi:hypothetical protein
MSYNVGYLNKHVLSNIDYNGFVAFIFNVEFTCSIYFMLILFPRIEYGTGSVHCVFYVAAWKAFNVHASSESCTLEQEADRKK